jgi:hypothetical protein
VVVYHNTPLKESNHLNKGGSENTLQSLRRLRLFFIFS